jgi:hypothetical protein
MYRALTEFVLVVHLAFILFAIAGGLLARRRLWRLMPFHLAALAWAVYAELSPGIVCPLTALEIFFAGRAGIAGDGGDFIAHYLVPIIYQEGLSSRWQDTLVLVVLAFNFLVYASLLRKKLKTPTRNMQPSRDR